MQIVFAGQGLRQSQHGGEADGEQFLRVVAAGIVSHQLEAYLARGGHGREGEQVLGDDVDACERQAAGYLPDVAEGPPLELGGRCGVALCDGNGGPQRDDWPGGVGRGGEGQQKNGGRGAVVGNLYADGGQRWGHADALGRKRDRLIGGGQRRIARIEQCPAGCACDLVVFGVFGALDGVVGVVPAGLGIIGQRLVLRGKLAHDGAAPSAGSCGRLRSGINGDGDGQVYRGLFVHVSFLSRNAGE